MTCVENLENDWTHLYLLEKQTKRKAMI